MDEITPESIRAQVGSAKPFTLVILRRGPNFDSTAHLHMDHLKHIFTMRARGEQLITLPVTEQDNEVVGISVLATADKAEAMALTEADPGVAAGRFTYEILQCMGIPGDALP